LHKKNAAAAAAVVRGLDDAALARSAEALKGMPPMSTEQMVVGILCGHIDDHIGSIKKTVKRLSAPPPDPGVTAPFGIPAARVPVVAVLGRGPSDWSHVGRWDVARGVYELGAWIRGDLYPQRCDLSPTGAGSATSRCAARRRGAPARPTSPSRGCPG